MSEIGRFTGNLEAFGVNASVNNRGTFGNPTDAADDTLDGNINDDWLTGWEMVGPSEAPTIQDFTSMGFTLGQIHAYLHQAGVPEWDASQEYYAGKSIANVGGVLYKCLTDDVGTNPVGDLTSTWIDAQIAAHGTNANGTFRITTDGDYRMMGVGSYSSGDTVTLPVSMIDSDYFITALHQGGDVTITLAATNKTATSFDIFHPSGVSVSIFWKAERVFTV